MPFPFILTQLETSWAVSFFGAIGNGKTQDEAIQDLIKSTQDRTAKNEVSQFAREPKPRPTLSKSSKIQQAKAPSLRRIAYGTMRENGITLPNPEELKILDRIFELKAQGMKVPNIAKQLAKEKIRDREGKKFTIKKISNIIKRYPNPNPKPAKYNAQGGFPYGFKIVDGQLVPNQDEITIMDHMFELKAQGRSFKQIQEQLAKEGTLTREGTQFSQRQISYIMNQTLTTQTPEALPRLPYSTSVKRFPF